MAALAAVLLCAFAAASWWSHGDALQRAPCLPRHRVDLSGAAAGEIEALPGVGPVLAARIVAERARAGFRTVDDLSRVHGVGPTTLERLRPFVRCGDLR